MHAPTPPFALERCPGGIELAVKSRLSRQDILRLMSCLQKEEAILRAREEAEFKARYNLPLQF